MDETKVLTNVITKVVKYKNFDVLNNYFSTASSNSEVFNTNTVITLLKLLKKETKVGLNNILVEQV